MEGERDTKCKGIGYGLGGHSGFSPIATRPAELHGPPVSRACASGGEGGPSGGRPVACSHGLRNRHAGGGRSYGMAGPAEGPVARGLQITGTGLHPSENQRHAVAYEMPPPPGRARDRETFHIGSPRF